MTSAREIAHKLALLMLIAVFAPNGHAAERKPTMFAAPLQKAWCDGQSFVRLRDDTLTIDMKNGAVEFSPVQLIEASGTRYVYGMPSSHEFRWTIYHRGTHIELNGLGIVPTDVAQHRFNLHANFYPCPT